MSKLSLNDLNRNKNWKEAVVVFTAASIGEQYNEKERSYQVLSSEYYFDGTKISNSLHGNCLDGNDNGVRLDHYQDKWKVEYCYIIK